MKLISHVTGFLSIALTLINSANANTPSPPLPQIAVGAYHFDSEPLIGRSSPFSPLILSSDEQAQNWSFVSTIDNVPMHHFSGFVSSVSCNTNVCAAVGMGISKLNEVSLITSKDKGKTWELVKSITDLPETLMQWFSSVSCNSDRCVAAGFYFENAVPKYSVLEGDASGKNWKSVNHIADSLNLKESMLTLANCNERSCLVAGTLGSDNMKQPLIFQKAKNATSWHFVDNIEGASELVNTKLDSGACADDFCVIGGRRFKYDSSIAHALLLASYDAGATWRVSSINGLPEIEERGNAINSVSCEGDHCIAVGKYETELSFFPLIVKGDTKSKTFNKINSIANIPIDYVSGQLDSVSCTADTCVAVGYAGDRDNIRFHPLLLVSEDNGDNWRFVDKITDLSTDDHTYTSVSCLGDICSVGGLYNSRVTQLPPPLIVSRDRGKHWSLVQRFSEVPSNLNSAEIYGFVDATNITSLTKG